MGLLSKRNIAKAKAMAEKNKDKIAAGVTKATDTIDKKTGGKHTDKLKKVDDAAKKYAGSGEAAPASGDAAATATDAGEAVDNEARTGEAPAD